MSAGERERRREDEETRFRRTQRREPEGYKRLSGRVQKTSGG
jgi:hypothetical protein